MMKKLLLSLALYPLLSATALDNWPDFRGPHQDGHAADGETLGVPLEWDEATGKNIAWKTAIHDAGHSSPVIWGDAIWLTTATMDGKKMYAVRVDKPSGKITHDILLFENSDPEPLGNPFNNYAAPSPTIEQGRVYIHFGSYGTACLDSDSGKILWQRRDIPCRHYRGPGSSPIIYKDLLILTMDGTAEQYLTALNKTTGATVWRTDRNTKWDDLDIDGKPKADGDIRKAYTTPIIASVAGKDVMMSIASRNIFGYEPQTGKELWSYWHTGFSNAARPVYGNGIAYVNSGYSKAKMFAAKIDGDSHGEIPATAKVWERLKNVPNKSSPLLLGGELYMVTDEGIAMCLDAKTGEECWVERLRDHFSGSPVLADGRIYMNGELNTTFVIEPGRTFKQLAANRLNDGGSGSLAISGKAIFLRSKTSLYRLETK